MADVGVRDLRHVDALLRVQADAVRRDELSGVQPETIAEPLQHLARGGHYCHTRAYVGRIAVDGHTEAEFANVNALVVTDIYSAGTVQIVPHVFEFAVAVEDLYR